MMRGLGLGALFGCVVVACTGGGGGGGGTSGSNGTNSTDAASFADRYCDILAGTCCPKHGKTYNKTQCVGLLGLSTAEGGQYDPVAGSTCLTALETAVQSSTACDDFGASDAALQTACNGVYKTSTAGTKKPGETCTIDSDCAPATNGDVTCETHATAGAETKACQVRVRAKEGDTCNGDKVGIVTEFSGDDSVPTLAICWADDGLFCADTTHTCTKRGNPGDGCAESGTQSCVVTARCDFTTQKCVALTPIGGACAEVSETSCVEDAYCDTTAGKCTATLAAGAACTTSQQCGQNGSCTNQKCTSADLTTAFICGN